MVKVLIVVESAGANTSPGNLSPARLQLVSHLKQVILANAANASADVQVVKIQDLDRGVVEREDDPNKSFLILPLTLNLPDWLKFSGQSIFQACQNVEGIRQQVKEWGYAVGKGNLWLPIVLTAKGPLYAEAIGVSSVADMQALETPGYIQPLHLPDIWRQPLYALGHRLLHHLQASPAVYLMQFSIQQELLCFDCLLPFPAEPALASIDVQSPDLLFCHWLCITGKPIMDLIVRPIDAFYQL